jgi:DnaJ-class molecular chaperone
MKITRTRALLILGLSNEPADELGAVGIKMAYARAVKANHPDTAGEVGAITMAELQAAKAFLLQYVAEPGAENACPLCKGRGIVHGKFGARKCENCKGDK